MVSATALRVEAADFGQGFKQGRFAASVLAHKERDVRVECDINAVAERWHIKRIRIAIHSLGQASYIAEIGSSRFGMPS